MQAPRPTRAGAACRRAARTDTAASNGGGAQAYKLQQHQHLTQRREAATRRSPGQRAAPHLQPPRNLAELVGIQGWSRAPRGAGASCSPVCSCAEAQLTGHEGECWAKAQEGDQGTARVAWPAGINIKASERDLRKRSVRPTSSVHVYTCARPGASSTPPPLAEAITRLKSLDHPSIFMPKTPPVFAAAPRRGRKDRAWSR